MSPVPMFDEIAIIAGASHQPVGEVLGSICAKDLEEVRSLLFNPPPVVQRTLEVASLILNVRRATSKPLAVPDWTSVQKTLSDADFHSKVLEYDVEQLRAAPALCTFIMNEYFRPASSSPSGSSTRRSSSHTRASSPAGINRSSASRSREPLTFARVYRASHAAGALFRWCVEVVSAAESVVVLPEPAAIEEPCVVEIQRMPPIMPALEPLKRLASQTSLNDIMSARAARAKVNANQEQTQKLVQFESERHFECVVAFSGSCHAVGSKQVAELRKVATAMKQRPGLTLHVAEYSMRAGCAVEDSIGKQRLYSVQLFLAAENVPFTCMPAEQSDPREGQEGVLCTLHLDEELLTFLRNGQSIGESDEPIPPTCPNAHRLRRRIGDGGHACEDCGEKTSGSCFYHCECYSLCSRCYANLAGKRDNTDLRETTRWLSKQFRMC